jgi:hypothetical protein
MKVGGFLETALYVSDIGCDLGFMSSDRRAQHRRQGEWEIGLQGDANRPVQVETPRLPCSVRSRRSLRMRRLTGFELSQPPDESWTFCRLGSLTSCRPGHGGYERAGTGCRISRKSQNAPILPPLQESAGGPIISLASLLRLPE